MRNPGKRRNISLVIALVAGFTLALVFPVVQGDGKFFSWFTVLLISFFTALGSLIAVVVFHFNFRLQRKLLAGHRLIARWSLSAAEWEQFVTDEARRKSEGRFNNFKANRATGKVIDVHIAENAIMIDGDFYHLGTMRGLQWIPDALACLEYNMVTSGKSGSVRWNVRIPVPETAVPLARKVWDHAHPPAKPGAEFAELHRLNRIRKIGLLLAFVFAPAVVFAVTAFKGGSRTNMTMVMMIVGGAGVLLGVLLGVLGHFMYRAERRRRT